MSQKQSLDEIFGMIASCYRCGGFLYVGNRVGVDKDGGCSNAAEGSISVLKLGNAGTTAELVEVVGIGKCLVVALFQPDFSIR